METPKEVTDRGGRSVFLSSVQFRRKPHSRLH